MAKLLTIVFSLIAVILFAKDTKHCVKWEEKVSTRCGSSESWEVTLHNECHEDVYWALCLEKTNGGWNCGSQGSYGYDMLKAGTKSVGHFVCSATMKYIWASCTGGFEECGFKSPK